MFYEIDYELIFKRKKKVKKILFPVTKMTIIQKINNSMK